MPELQPPDLATSDLASIALHLQSADAEEIAIALAKLDAIARVRSSANALNAVRTAPTQRHAMINLQFQLARAEHDLHTLMQKQPN